MKEYAMHYLPEALKPKKICIIGGGIAGLAAGIYLIRAGFDVTICDRTQQIGSGGYAFLLLENGLAVLAHMGLMTEIRKQGDEISQIILHNERGLTLSKTSLQDAVCIKRTALCDILYNLLPPNQVLIDHHFSHFLYDSNGFVTEACFLNGTKMAADFFIGADGARSQVRALIDEAFQMPAVRIKELVSSVKMPPPINHTLVKFQHSQGRLAAGYVPIGKDYVNWYIQFDSQYWEANELIDKRQLCRKLIGDFPEPFSTFINNTDFNHSHLWNTFNMTVLPQCHDKNVLIIGDAAHTFSPFSSQGVNTALQDAYALYHSLMESMPLQNCLALYSERRQPSLHTFMKAGHDMINSFLLPYTKPFIPLVVS